MTRTEQAYLDYVKANIMPILNGYIGDEINPKTAKKINDEIVSYLRTHMIVHDWEVKVDD